ncbi:MAG TPA: hypothetical protein VKZ59_06285 [Acidobacteriota bacterium]|nr:hypothetical protein [Acidobacteriota bacterium]
MPKRLLSESSGSFKFSRGDAVEAPLYFGGSKKVPGKIAEGINRDGHIFYEIEAAGGGDRRFAAREEDVNLLNTEDEAL